jgi:lysophospholipase L1-like esterase
MNLLAVLLAARIVVIGDSVAHGLAPSLHATNLGINGARTRNVLTLLPTVQPILRSATTIVVSIGGNDMYGDNTARLFTTIWPSMAMHRTLDRIESIVAQLHRINPAARVFLLGLYDPYHRPDLDKQVALWDSRLIARFAGDARVQVIRIADLFMGNDRLSATDHYHPSAEGYRLIAARVLQSSSGG